MPACRTSDVHRIIAARLDWTRDPKSCAEKGRFFCRCFHSHPNSRRFPSCFVTTWVRREGKRFRALFETNHARSCFSITRSEQCSGTHDFVCDVHVCVISSTVRLRGTRARPVFQTVGDFVLKVTKLTRSDGGAAVLVLRTQPF